jgi:hypothetical protein
MALWFLSTYYYQWAESMRMMRPVLLMDEGESVSQDWPLSLCVSECLPVAAAAAAAGGENAVRRGQFVRSCVRIRCTSHSISLCLVSFSCLCVYVYSLFVASCCCRIPVPGILQRKVVKSVLRLLLFSRFSPAERPASNNLFASSDCSD